jgi:DNA repair ATPase RecN
MNRLLIVASLAIFTIPLCAQGQQPNAAELKRLAENVVKIISGDKAKTQAYCQINSLSGPMVEALQEKNDKKFEELFQKIDELEDQLDPKYHALFNALFDADPNSKDVQEILSMFAMLDQFCPD